MKKIEINLYPLKRSNNKKIIQVVEKFFPIACLTVLGFLVLNILFFLITLISYMPYNTYTKEWNQIRPQASEINSLKKEVNTLKDKKKEYEELLTPDLKMAHIMADLYAALPKNIWLGEITFREGMLGFVGFVVEWKENYSVSINTFIKQLKKSEYFAGVFKSITLQSQKKLDFSGREIMKFEVECLSSNSTKD